MIESNLVSLTSDAPDKLIQRDQSASTNRTDAAMSPGWLAGLLDNTLWKESEMLVLSRKAGEEIQIGDDIVVTITRLGRNTARVGIQAPPEVSIRRKEIAPASPARNLQGIVNRMQKESLPASRTLSKY